MGKDRGRHVVFVVFQGRQCYLRLRCIGAVYRFAVVAQGRLREPFRIACHLRPLCPGVTVAVQRDATDAKVGAALPEFSRAVLGP